MTTSLTSKLFVDGTEEAYKHNLEREIDKLDCREILTQLSSSRLNSETANNIEEIDLEERKQREYTRNVQIGLIDQEDYPKTKFPEEIRPNSAKTLSQKEECIQQTTQKILC